ncbi:MAG: hypothetical protein KAS98_09040 [Deltaproteobacteria bacterium]|jgi:transcriptional regulator NrdR family protein|nr:hypothetical protein [Deltaproteobacteria bacterium]
MNCPHCAIKLKTRKTFDSATFTFRVKQCPECKRYFKIYERSDFNKVEKGNKLLKKILRKVKKLVT